MDIEIKNAKDGSNAKDIITGLDHPRDIALDVEGGKIYWTQGFGTYKICCANLDGKDVQDLISGLNYPRDIALDVRGDKIYWTEGSPKTAKILLAVRKGKKYWTEGIPETPAKIRCADLDGTNIQDIITAGLEYPNGITLDVTGGKIYWTQSRADQNTGRIRCAELDGTNIQDLVSGLARPADIVLDVENGKMYWIDTGANKIQCANLYGIGIQDIITEVIGLKSITVVRPK